MRGRVKRSHLSHFAARAFSSGRRKSDGGKNNIFAIGTIYFCGVEFIDFAIDTVEEKFESGTTCVEILLKEFLPINSESSIVVTLINMKTNV